MRRLAEIRDDLDALFCELQERTAGHVASMCMCPSCRAKFQVLRIVHGLEDEVQKEAQNARSYAESR